MSTPLPNTDFVISGEVNYINVWGREGAVFAPTAELNRWFDGNTTWSIIGVTSYVQFTPKEETETFFASTFRYGF